MIPGTEKFIDNLINLMDTDPSFLLSAIRCLPLDSSIRDLIGQAMQTAKAKVRAYNQFDLPVLLL